MQQQQPKIGDEMRKMHAEPLLPIEKKLISWSLAFYTSAFPFRLERGRLMNSGKTVFSQLMGFLPLHQFRKCVLRSHGNHRVRSFSCLDQFFCMAFAQLTYRDSLRDIEACLRAIGTRRYHMGIRGNVARNTLAHANETRDWRIYADFAQILIDIARPLYANDDFGLELNETVYALDSSTIELCLSIFPWARYQKQKGAVRLHTLLDLRGPIPSWLWVTDGKVGDVTVLDSPGPR